jgi:hypothetical protein
VDLRRSTADLESTCLRLNGGWGRNGPGGWGRNGPPISAKFLKSKPSFPFGRRHIPDVRPFDPVQRERTVMALSHAPVTIRAGKTRTIVRSMTVFIERSCRCPGIVFAGSLMQPDQYQQETNDGSNRDHLSNERCVMFLDIRFHKRIQSAVNLGHCCFLPPL